MKPGIPSSVAIAMFAILQGCGRAPDPSAPHSTAETAVADNARVASLAARVTELEAENRALRQTPAVLLAAVTAAADDAVSQRTAVEALTARFPGSAEARQGVAMLAKAQAARDKELAESRRVAALGFKALRVSPEFKGAEATIAVGAIAQGKRWIYDAYDDNYRYSEAEKGSVYVTAAVKVSSKQKDPRLPGVALYAADGGALRRLGTFGYRFTRWDDFASYLGNNADYRNDFAHSSVIPMTIGLEVSTESAVRPLYVVATTVGCNSRSYDRFHQPPVSYHHQGCPPLASELRPTDFEKNGLAVIKRID